jgi:trehalose 6-phosphate synthase/phosphatase
MPETEQEFRMKNMQQRIRSYDVYHWANDFISQLMDSRKKREQFAVSYLNTWQKVRMSANYVVSKKRLLLLDYDGTLVNFAGEPEAAVPTNEVIKTLQRLSASPKNDVYIISGRSGKMLEQWFSGFDINLIAEHGAKTKLNGDKWQNNIHSSVEWKNKATEIMRSYEQRCANSLFEEKEFSVAWHYRKAENALGELRAKELQGELSDVFKNTSVKVINGNKVIELRSLEADKGAAASKIVARTDYDFILAAGDDKTDEDMFRMLKDKNAWTIKIGSGISYARYNVETPKVFLNLLGMLM